MTYDTIIARDWQSGGDMCVCHNKLQYTELTEQLELKGFEWVYSIIVNNEDDTGHNGLDDMHIHIYKK